jgi:hypothetical protein
VAPPLQLGVVGPYLVRGVWFTSHLPLEGTDRIYNFGLWFEVSNQRILKSKTWTIWIQTKNLNQGFGKLIQGEFDVQMTWIFWLF